MDNFDNFNLNISYLLSKMPNNSLLVMGDLRIYSKIGQFQFQVKQLIQELDFDSQILCLRHSEILDFITEITLPTIILQHLLTSNDGLIPRKKINCNFLSIYKTYKYETIHRQLEQLFSSIKTLDTNRSIQKQDRYNLIQQIKILRIALIAVSAIAVVSLMLSIISLRR